MEKRATVSIEVAAKMLNKSQSTIYRLCQQNVLERIKKGNHYHITQDSLDCYKLTKKPTIEQLLMKIQQLEKRIERLEKNKKISSKSTNNITHDPKAIKSILDKIHDI